MDVYMYKDTEWKVKKDHPDELLSSRDSHLPRELSGLEERGGGMK